MKKRFAMLCGLTASACACATLAPSAHAAPIVWGTATNISGDNDVSLLGTLVSAYNFGGTSVGATTVNGVTFAAFGVAGGFGQTTTVGNVSVVETNPGAFFGGNSNFGAGTAPFSSLSVDYQGLLSSAIFSVVPSDIEVTINNLTVGQTYLYQFWVNNSNATARPTDFVTATASSGVTLLSNATSGAPSGGLGQYATGTFIADSTSQIISNAGVNGIPGLGTGGPILNGFQLRNLSTSVAAPEPGSLALLTTGVAGAVIARRRRRA